MRPLISNVSTGNRTLCRGQKFACELLVERASRGGEGMEAKLHALFTAALHAGGWSASHPGRLTFVARSRSTHRIGR